MTWSRRDLFKRMGAVAGAAFVAHKTAAVATAAAKADGWQQESVRADRFTDHQGREFMMVQLPHAVKEGDLVTTSAGLTLGAAMADAPKDHFAFVQLRGPAIVNAVDSAGGSSLPMDPVVDLETDRYGGKW